MSLELFDVNVIEVKRKKTNFFYFINIEDYTNKLKDFLDNSIASIWNGVLGEEDIEIVKIELQNWFYEKDENKKKQDL